MSDKPTFANGWAALERVYIERDDLTNNSYVFGTRGMGFEYVRADLLATRDRELAEARERHARSVAELTVELAECRKERNDFEVKWHQAIAIAQLHDQRATTAAIAAAKDSRPPPTRRRRMGEMAGLIEPKRVQLSRKKGWRMPPNTVKVDRTTKWGNPITVAGYYDAGYNGGLPSALRHCVDGYSAWLAGTRHWSHGVPMPPPPDITALRGKNLACWCKIMDQQGNAVPCHADVLLSLANGIPIEDIQRENIRRAKGEKAT